MSAYTREELGAVYELGRLYFEMGYFSPAERIFNGLCLVDKGYTPSRVGLGLVKIERGLFEEASSHFRLALQEGNFPLQSKLGMAFAFIASGERARAASLLAQLEKEHSSELEMDNNIQAMWEAASIRCQLPVTLLP